MNLPKEFLDNIIRIWGNEGTLWLQQLPMLIEHFTNQWQLKQIKHFDNLSFNYVAHAYSDLFTRPVVLKIGAPHPTFINELKALEFYNGNGAVKLLAQDGAKYAILLERISPGITARGLFPTQDDRAVEYACDIMQKLHVKPINKPSPLSLDKLGIGRDEWDHSASDFYFKTINDWFTLFDTLVIPSDLQPQVNKARQFVQELAKTPQPHYLLHGDLHHDNILIDALGNGIAIDPKGVVGEQAYEVGAFMCNPAELCEQPDVPALLARRLDQFSRLLNIDRQRLAKACYVRITLSACWTVQDKGNWHDDAKFAESMLDSVVR